MDRLIIIRLIIARLIIVIATHDEKLVYEVVYLSIIKYKYYPTLRGIRYDLIKLSIKYSFKVDEYIPYGIEWTGYMYRRIRERKSKYKNN